VINASSKTGLSIMKSLVNTQTSKIKSLNLMDYFLDHSRFERCFEFKDQVNQVVQDVSLTRLNYKSHIREALNDSDYLIYFTHDYFENVTCKNELKQSIGRLSSECPNLQKSIFVNLLEYSQFRDPKYFDVSVGEDFQLIKNNSKNTVLWTDFVYSDTSSIPTQVSQAENIYFNEELKKFVHVDKVSDAIAEILSNKNKEKMNYVQPSDSATGSDFIEMKLANDGSESPFFTKALRCMTASAEERHFTNIFNRKEVLEEKLKNINKVTNPEAFDKDQAFPLYPRVSGEYSKLDSLKNE